MRRKSKWWHLSVFGTVLLIGIGLFVWVNETNQLGTNITEQEFSQLKDKEMEIVDTSVFVNEKLEKWYTESRQEKGELLYKSGDSTYILISTGKVNDENTFLLLNGVKVFNGELVVGYDTLEMNDVPNVKFKDDIRSTLIKVKGNYNQVKAIKVSGTTDDDPPSPK